MVEMNHKWLSLYRFSLSFVFCGTKHNFFACPFRLHSKPHGSFKISAGLLHLREITVELQAAEAHRKYHVFPLPQITRTSTTPPKNNIYYRTYICATAQLSLLEMRGHGPSDPPTLMRLTCLLEEVLEKRLQKRKVLQPQALMQRALRDTFIINNHFLWALS